jgi:hypothetical protein
MCFAPSRKQQQQLFNGGGRVSDLFTFHGRRPFPFLLCLMMAACGGGGGGGTTTTGPASVAPPPAPSPSLSISQTQLNVSGQTGQSAPASVKIPIAVSNPPTSALTTKITYTGEPIAAASVTLPTTGTGYLTVAFADPSRFGAGSFSLTVTLQVCIDTNCAQSITGAPANVTINYTVSGDALPPVSFYDVPPDTFFSSNTSITAPQTATASFFIKNVPAAGLYLRLSQPQGGFITDVTSSDGEDSLGQIDLTVNLTLKSPASLGSGFFQSSAFISICYDQACNNPVAGSPVTLPVTYEVFLTQGKEYSLAVASNLGISDFGYDPTNQQLYVATLPDYPLSSTGAVLQIDPTTGNTVAQLAMSDTLTTLAVSDDGGFLYTGSKNNPTIYRLTLPGLEQDITIPLGTSTTWSGTEPLVAGQIAVTPGAAHNFAVALAHASGSDRSQGIALFQDATELPQTIAPLGDYTNVDSLAWGATSETLYASRLSIQAPYDEEIDTLTASSTGLSLQSSTKAPQATEAVGQISYDTGKIYATSGVVRNAASGAVVGNIALPDQFEQSSVPSQILCITPDGKNSRVFVLIHDLQSSHALLLAYSLPNLTLQSMIDLGYDSFNVAVTTRMKLWGTQGVAFNRNGLQILSGSFLARGPGDVTSSTESKHSVREPYTQTLFVHPSRQKH